MQAVHTPPASNRLKELRTAHKLRLIDVAALIDKDQSMVFRYEAGSTPVPNDVLRKLSRKYDVSVEHLMGWDKDRTAA